jgi:uncharacterized protein YbcI
MKAVALNHAEIEYAVMIAVLDFQTEFMKSTYSQVQVYLFEERLYVTSTRSAPIPAEVELAKSPEGHELLHRFHRALFDSCQHVLRERIEQVIGVKIQNIVAYLDPKAGRSTLVIKLLRPIFQSTPH